MSNFSLFSFNSGKSSLAHINYETHENKDVRINCLKPEDHNIFDIRTRDMRTWRGYCTSDTGTDFVCRNFAGYDYKNDKVILSLTEEKICWDEKKEVEVKEVTRSCWKGNELILTLRPDQCVDVICSRFYEFNYTVKIAPLENKPDSYVVKFPDKMMAEKALAEAPMIGYKLVKKRRPRPSPRCPIMFKALRRLKMRSGKAFSRDVLGWINKDELVIVNQVKGRRARLMFVENGKISNLGWVSLHTSNGDQLLEQTEVSLNDWKLLDIGLTSHCNHFYSCG